MVAICIIRGPSSLVSISLHNTTCRFALFQTKWTNYSVAQSPWKGGKGDVVKEFVTSCREFGISPCLYFINAWVRVIYSSCNIMHISCSSVLEYVAYLAKPSQYGAAAAADSVTALAAAENFSFPSGTCSRRAITTQDCWESQDSPDVYLERQLGMLSDLLNTSRYGQIDRLWFDEYGFGASPSQAPPGLFPGFAPPSPPHYQLPACTLSVISSKSQRLNK